MARFCLALTALAAALLAAPRAGALTPFGASELSNTSEYALGTYVYNVVFIQDDILRNPAINTHPPSGSGQVIHWSAAEIADRQQRITDAVDFWNAESAARHHPGARLDITVNFVNAAQPITVADIGGQGSTIGYGDALAFLDPAYGTVSDLGAVQRFNRDTRNLLGKHWAFTTFVKPYNGTATTRLNGPHTNAYEDDPSWTYAHEFGHIFGALDEYVGNTAQRSGYLNALNSNSVNLPGGAPNPNAIHALMRTRDRYNLSDGTVNQIGWTDTDGDTIPDILDTIPTLTADVAPSAQTSGAFTLTADAVVTPLPSPSNRVGDITINTLTAAQYRVDGGAWVDLLPEDGQFGGYAEAFALEITNPSAGGPQLDLRIYNSVGNFAETTLHAVVIPEPATATLALLALAGLRRRRCLRVAH